MNIKTFIVGIVISIAFIVLGEGSIPVDQIHSESVKTAFARYLAGEMSKSDFAAICHRQGMDAAQSADARFQLLSGAFRCYMESGNVSNARDVIVTMMDQGLPRQDIVNLLRESNIYFGVNCFDYGCPYILDSIHRAGTFFKPTDLTVESLNDLAFGSLKSPCFNLTNVIETVETCLPLPDRENGAMVCTAKCIRVNVASLRQNADGVKLYLTPISEEVFQMEFLLSRPSYVKENVFEQEMDELIKLLSAHFSVDISVIKFKGRDGVNRDDDHPSGRNNVLFGDGLFHDSFEIEHVNIGDYGVGPLRINGSWYEDIHHFKFIRIRIADIEKLSMMRRESHNKKIRLTNRIGLGKLGLLDLDFEYLPIGDFINPTVRNEIKSRNLGAAGRRSECSKLDVAVWYYDRASACGNPMAAKWLVDHPAVATFRARRKSIYGIEVGKLSSGVRLDGDGLSLHCEWVDFNRSHLRPYDNCNGVIIGTFWNMLSGNSSGVVCSGVINFNTDMSQINGIQVAGLYNAGYGTTYNGVLIGGANMTFDSMCNGISVAVAADVQGVMNGVQVAWACGSCELHGFSIAPYVSCSGSLFGVQVAGVSNFVMKDIPLPDWSKSSICGDENVFDLTWGDGVACGLQVSGLLNYVDGEMYGVQIGAVNYAKRLSGVQIGIMNLVGEGGIFLMPVLNMNF